MNSARTSIALLFTSVEYASPGHFDVFSSDPASLPLTNDFPSDEIQLATSEGQFWYYPSNSPLVNFPLQNAIGTQPTGTAGSLNLGRSCAASPAIPRLSMAEEETRSDGVLRPPCLQSAILVGYLHVGDEQVEQVRPG